MKKIFTLFAALIYVVSMFAATETVYFVNADKWTGTIKAYAWTSSSNAPWPGTAATKEAEQLAGCDVYSYSAEAGTYANVIFNNGSKQTADLKWTAGKYYVRDGWYTKEEAAEKLGQPVEYESVYFVNVDSWSTVKIYTWSPEVGTWPGIDMKKETETIGGKEVWSHTEVKGASFGGVIFNNGSGTQTADLKWTAGKYYVKDDWYTKEEAEAKLSGGNTPGNDPQPETGVTYNVTVPAGTNACYIAGEMNNWSHIEMTKVDDTHYTLTLETATTAMKYKYCSGPSWDYVEMQEDGVTDVQDRTYSANDVVVKWKTVYNPNGSDTPGDDPQPETGVTYNVTVPVGTNACYIAGEMNNWSHAEMTKVDDTHYTLTLETATTAMKYKYCSGPSWDYVEKTVAGEDVADRVYSANDVVEAWAAVYDPTSTPIDPAQITYVLMGVAGDWTTGIAMTKNESSEWEEYMLIGQTIAEGDSVKVVRLENGTAKHWCGNVKEGVTVTITPDDKNGNIILAPGAYDFYYDVAADAIWIAVSSSTAVEDVVIENKATKIVRNGQMYILRDGVMYNIFGQIAE